MNNTKSEKELAFLRDLYVSTDWGERFAGLIDAHLKLPEKGNVLYLGAGTGGHPIEWKEQGGDDLEITGVDESEECLDLARAKAVATNSEVKFLRSPLDFLPFEDDLFDVVVAENSLSEPEALPGIISEMARVAKPGAVIAISLATASSFSEFFSIYWEALQRLGHGEAGGIVETLITGLPTVAGIERVASLHRLETFQSWIQKEEFKYGTSKDFLSSPLITDFLLAAWIELLPRELRAGVIREISNLMDEEHHGIDFSLSVKATLVMGRKSRKRDKK